MEKNDYTEEALKKLNEKTGKLYLMCLFVGILTGIIVSIYRWGLERIAYVRKGFFSDVTLDRPLSMIKIWIIFIIVGLIADFLYRKYPRTSGSGIPQVKGLILEKIDYKNWYRELIAKFLGGILGIGAGLSLGREGPSVQLGSYVGYGFSKLFKKDEKDRKYLITSGASAGLAGAFGAPIAGVMFSIEEMYKYISTKLLVCIFLSSIAADFVGRRFFGVHTAFDISIKYPLNINPYFQIFLFAIFGVIIAVFGKLFSFCLIKTQDIFENIKVHRIFKIISIMTLSFALCFIIPEVTGGGHGLVENLVRKKEIIEVLIVIFVIKLLFTSISYATGFAGGIFLPMLVLGAIVGKIFGEVIDILFETGPDFTVHFVVIGMAAYFVSVVRAPITGTLLILEMTGSFDLLLAITTASTVAFYMTKHFKQQPIYDILYERMKKDGNVVEDKNKKKTIIKIPVMHESELDNKYVKDIYCPEGMLIIAIVRDGIEKIPNGNSKIQGGDILILLLPEERVGEIKEDILNRATVY